MYHFIKSQCICRGSRKQLAVRKEQGTAHKVFELWCFHKGYKG